MNASLQFRDFILALVFGLIAPYLWIAAVGLSTVAVEAPFLNSLGSGLSPAVLKAWIGFYFFLLGFLTSFACAALVALPLGYFLKGGHRLAWIIFVLVFLLVSVGPGLWQRDLEGVVSFFKSYEMWVFLFGSALFLFLGKRWHARRTQALA